MGKLIAFAGLPSSGKSSTAKALGRLMGADVMLEPEEAAWPDLVKNRGRVGHFTALSWFRTIRVPQLFAADTLRSAGKPAVIDSYYDVLVNGYLGDRDFEWLISREDPYFNAALEMTRADWQLLPKADIIVFLSLNKETWSEFMGRRDRDFDRSAELDRHFAMQAKMLAVCKQAVVEHGGQLVELAQTSSTPEATARRVAAAIDGLDG